ncbi:Ribosomal protein L11 methyltransferase [uncultured Defluviicoccus sp.]|uniref:Ribosomal protein L11 methyltransferase n=1 Tax=metagenome TaxID=256318 RepID=A0A380TAK8_9ZZZZ|nr:Ribosomal protein L11 methyltransferase [uncultured Defluviicoccus sp.]
MASAVWRVAVTVPQAAAPAFEAAMQSLAASVVSLDAGGGCWCVQGLSSRPPERAALALALNLAAVASGLPAPEATIEPVAEEDWLARGLRDLPPLRIGPFFVHGAHVHEPPPLGSIALQVEAGMAFGSGHHASTAGCLEALAGLRHHTVRRVLDVGCGSGILGIAAAKLWRCPVLAVDIDPDAVAETRANARINGVAPCVRALCVDGVHHPLVRAAAPFDLVVANILARPLKRLAPSLREIVGAGGWIILGGFIAADARQVAAPYRAIGLALRSIHRAQGWATVVLERRGP